MNAPFLPRDFARKMIQCQLKFKIRNLFLLFLISRLCNTNKLCQVDYATAKSCSEGLNESRLKHYSCLKIKGIYIIQICHNRILFMLLENIGLADRMLYNGNGELLYCKRHIVHAGNMVAFPLSDHL